MSFELNFPIDYVPLPDRSGANGLGKMWIGNPNSDPKNNIADRITVYVVRQNDTPLAIGQPIFLSVGGVPLYNGSPVQLEVDIACCVQVTDILGAQIFYAPYAGKLGAQVASNTASLATIRNGVVSFSALASTAPFAVGDIVYLAQHTASGIGGGHFKAFSGSVTSDGGTQINSATTGVYWKRINYTYVTSAMYGALGNGAASDRASFLSANTSTPSNQPIYILPGAYNFGGSNYAAPNRRFICVGNVTFPSGQLTGCTFETVSTIDGSVKAYIQDYAGSNWQTRSPYKMGSQYGSAAISIGSADPASSPYGTVFFADGHSDFFAMTPEESGNPVEINLYPSAPTGRATAQNGTGNIIARTDLFNIPFTSDMVDKAIMFNGVGYLVSAYISATTITLKTFAGAAVVFGSTFEETFHFCNAIYRGKCNVNGTAVTRLSGHIFPGYGVLTGSALFINNTKVASTGTINVDNITLTSPLGVLNNVDWAWYCYIEGETTAFRMNHSKAGEQFTITTIGATSDGNPATYYITSVTPPGFSYRPIVIRNNNVDGIVVAPIASAAYIGIGSSRRNPSCLLDANGEIRSNQLSLSGNILSNWAINGTTDISINYNSYQGGLTQFRNTTIYDGKGVQVATFEGSSRNMGIGVAANASYRLFVAGNIAPSVDNSSTCGGSGQRWSAVWAANGTIQTSHGPDKVIDDEATGNLVSHAAQFVDSLSPVTFRWKEGGAHIVDSEEMEEFDEPVYETKITREETVKIVDGKAIVTYEDVESQNPKQIEVFDYDENGNPIYEHMPAVFGEHRELISEPYQRHKKRLIIETQKSYRPKQTTITKKGERLHAGFIAQDVKKVLDDLGMDFGVWGLEDSGNPDSKQWLRPDQLIPVLWSALKETRAEVSELRNRLNEIH